MHIIPRFALVAPNMAECGCGCSNGHTLVCVFGRSRIGSIDGLLSALGQRWVERVALYAVGVWCYNAVGSLVWAVPLAEYDGWHFEALARRGSVSMGGDVLRLEVR